MEVPKLELLNYIKEDLILLDLDAKDNFEVLEKMTKVLLDKGYVKESFREAVIEREKVFPTGIKTGMINAAIPHADSEHVIAPAMAVSVLSHPVDFNRMDVPDQKIPVKIVFMLAIKNSNEQLNSLKELMELLRNPPLIELACNCKSRDEFLDILLKAGDSNLNY